MHIGSGPLTHDLGRVDARLNYFVILENPCTFTTVTVYFAQVVPPFVAFKI